MTPRVASMVDWMFSPEWVTLDQASFLTGHDADTLRDIIADGGVVAERAGAGWLIEKESLREFRDALLEVLQGCWG